MAKWLDYQSQRLRAPCPENCRPHAWRYRLQRLKSISIVFLVVSMGSLTTLLSLSQILCFPCCDTSKSVATFATVTTPLLRPLPPLGATNLTLSTNDQNQAQGKQKHKKINILPKKSFLLEAMLQHQEEANSEMVCLACLYRQKGLWPGCVHQSISPSCK